MDDSGDHVRGTETSCLTCNHRQEADPNSTATCELRRLALRRPYQTFCANHHEIADMYRPRPVGPLFRKAPDGERLIDEPSPDNKAVRDDLLQALNDFPGRDIARHIEFLEVIIWELGQFREIRAIAKLIELADWSHCNHRDTNQRTARRRLALMAQRALLEIDGHA